MGGGGSGSGVRGEGRSMWVVGGGGSGSGVRGGGRLVWEMGGGGYANIILTTRLSLVYIIKVGGDLSCYSFIST